jgi:hypothetical protein
MMDDYRGKADLVIDDVSEKLDKLESALNALADKVVNLANKLEEHLNERDAHNPGVMRKK